jgi:hypothetical protein
VNSTSDTALDTREKNSDRWVSVFTEGDELYDAMLDDIRSAQERIRLESYILSDDVVGGQFFSELEKSSVLGCVVGVRADYAGSWGAVPQTRQRSRHGERWSWAPWCGGCWILNRRNHRKLLIIDGRRLRRWIQHSREFTARLWPIALARHARPIHRPAGKDAIQLSTVFPVAHAWRPTSSGIGLLPNNTSLDTWCCAFSTLPISTREDMAHDPIRSSSRVKSPPRGCKA